MGVTQANVQFCEKINDVLRYAGITVNEISGARTRGRTLTATYRAGTVHWTGSKNTPLSTIRDGYSGLPGPLSQYFAANTTKKEVYWVAAGYSNHAGAAALNAKNEIADGDVDTSSTFEPGPDSVYANDDRVGIEVATDKEFSDIQLYITIAWAAGVAVASGAYLDKDKDGRIVPVMGHNEQTDRKIDPGDIMPYIREQAKQLALRYCYDKGLLTPPTPVVIDLTFKIGALNCQLPRFGGGTDFKKRGVFMKDQMRCSIYGLQETTEEMRNAIRAVLGPQFKVYVHGAICVMWDSNKWTHVSRADVSFANNGLHGALRVTLRGKNGKEIDVISIHVRPGSIATLDQKQADIRKALTLVRNTVPTVLLGDFSTGTAESIVKTKGFVPATPYADTMPHQAGAQRVDRIFTLGFLILSGIIIDPPGVIPDHSSVVSKLTLKGQNTT